MGLCVGAGIVSSEIQSYRDLVAWQKAFKLGLMIYRLTKQFPDEERWGLISQLRRASVSVPSNIAEGYGRQSRNEYVRFLRIARGSLYEIDTQLLFAVELQYVAQEMYDQTKSLLDECSRVLGGLIRSLSP